jgi:hypothetical protein
MQRRKEVQESVVALKARLDRERDLRARSLALSDQLIALLEQELASSEGLLTTLVEIAGEEPS